MTVERPALHVTADPDDDAQPEERAVQRHGVPVSDGPGRHHANADATHSPAPAPRVTHRF